MAHGVGSASQVCPAPWSGGARVALGQRPGSAVGPGGGPWTMGVSGALPPGVRDPGFARAAECRDREGGVDSARGAARPAGSATDHAK